MTTDKRCNNNHFTILSPTPARPYQSYFSSINQMSPQTRRSFSSSEICRDQDYDVRSVCMIDFHKAPSGVNLSIQQLLSEAYPHDPLLNSVCRQHFSKHNNLVGGARDSHHIFEVFCSNAHSTGSYKMTIVMNLLHTFA